jgi:hypothetical protein
MADNEATPESDSPLDSTACGAAVPTGSSALPASPSLQAVKTQAAKPTAAINVLMVVSFRSSRALRDVGASARRARQTNIALRS